jgi:hypothetical protein
MARKWRTCGALGDRRTREELRIVAENPRQRRELQPACREPTFLRHCRRRSAAYAATISIVVRSPSMAYRGSPA